MRILTRILTNHYFKSVYYKTIRLNTTFLRDKTTKYKNAIYTSGVCGSLIFGYAFYAKHCALNEKIPIYTDEDVETHNSPETGIWVSYNSNVYDITDFVGVHPGGEMILLAAGKPIEPFWEHFANHKTMDTNELLETMKIGKLAPSKSGKPKFDLKDPYAYEPRRNKKLIVHSGKPFNAETPPKVLVENYITANENFYIRNHLPVPIINPKEHMLQIVGLGISKDISLSLDDLKTLFPKRSVTTTISCAGNRRSGLNNVKDVMGLQWGVGAISTSEWGGVYLVDVLNHFGVDLKNPKIKHIHFEGMDKQVDNNPYRVSVPSTKVLDPQSEVLLAYEMNGQDIPLDHGYPLRIIVPGVTGARNVKWLSKIEFSQDESPSHWQLNDYKVFSPSVSMENADFSTVPAIQEMPVNSAICDPQDGETIQPIDGKIKLKGYAWSGGGRPISRVDVSVDGGKTWLTTTLSSESKDNKWAWTLWESEVLIDKNQELVKVICKAVDSSYNVQPETHESIWNFRGLLNNAWHQININIKK